MKKRACPEQGRRVFVGMSGGVDSSVAAWLLKKRGYDVTGVFLRCYNLDGCAEKDAEDARRVAARIGIPFYVFDLEKEYKDKVVEYMIDGYRRGLTPNPDVMCNKEIKFGLFLEKALALGADYVATGHYVRRSFVFQRRLSTRSSGEPQAALSARSSAKGGTKPNAPPRAAVKQNSGSWFLLEGKDSNKDQSYFLWTLTQKQLKHCLFPIGDYLKSEVRVIAKKAGLPTAAKKDSQGICFLGDISMADFLKSRLSTKKGKVLGASGEVIGEHEGAYFYTIGQRHTGLANRRGQIANSQPLYVVTKDTKKNILTVAEGSENPDLFQKELELENVNFFDPKITSLIRANRRIMVFARVRYRQSLAKAFLSKSPSARSGLRLVFNNPQKFVAAGQSAVFYSKKGIVLGGGVIK